MRRESLDALIPSSPEVAISPIWRGASPLQPIDQLPLTEQREEVRAASWAVDLPSNIEAQKALILSLHADTQHASATGRGVGAALDDALELLRQQQERRRAAEAAEVAAKGRAAAEKQAAEAAEAARAAAAAAERERAAEQAAAKAQAEAQAAAAAEQEARAKAEAEAAAKASAVAKATASTKASVPPPTAAGADAQSVAPSQAAAEASATTVCSGSSMATMASEWQSARTAVESEASLIRQHGGAEARRITTLVMQLARVHAVVWEKASEVCDLLAAMRSRGAEAHLAGCSSFAKRVLGQGEMMVDKQPGMAYALAGLTLHVGEAEPAVWSSLDQQLKATCCYCVPHYVRKPASGDQEQWRELLGYQKKGDGKSWESKAEYYGRMAGHVTLYATLLQQSMVAHFTPPAEDMTWKPVANPLGVSAAWAWLARLLNQKPQRITATILLAFLKPTAHALAAAYPRQFHKLLAFIRAVYSPMIHQLVDGKDQPPEEQAAISNLDTWMGDALSTLEQRRPIAVPADSEMPAFKEPDNTNDAESENW